MNANLAPVPVSVSPCSSLSVVTPIQAARIDRIKQYHLGCIGAFGQQMGYAFLCGLELNAAKAELPHGKFIPWRETFLPQISRSSVQRYMLFAETLRGEMSHAVGDLNLGTLQLTNGHLPEKEKEAVLKAVHKVSDGKSLTAMYRDLGVIRQPKKPQHHPVTLTPEQQLQADLNAAEALLHDACSAISLLRENHHQAITKAKPDTRRKLMEHALWLTATLRKFNKGRKPRK